MSGWLFPTTVRMPRIWMNDDAPGSPDCALTKTFGAFAARASTTFCSLLLEIWSADTLLRTLPSFSVEVAVPAPVTTISPSCSGLGSSAKSCSITPARSDLHVHGLVTEPARRDGQRLAGRRTCARNDDGIAAILARVRAQPE